MVFNGSLRRVQALTACHAAAGCIPSGLRRPSDLLACTIDQLPRCPMHRCVSEAIIGETLVADTRHAGMLRRAVSVDGDPAKCLHCSSGSRAKQDCRPAHERNFTPAF